MTINFPIDQQNTGHRTVGFYINNAKPDKQGREDYFTMYVIEQGYLEIELDHKRFLCSGPSFLCLNDRQTIKTIHSHDLLLTSVYFLPQFINKNMTVNLVHSDDYVDLCDSHDLLLLRPFLSSEFSQSYICGLSPEMIHRIQNLLAEGMRQFTNQPDWYWSCRARSSFLDCLHLMERLYYENNEDAIGKTIFDHYIPNGMDMLSTAIQMIWCSYSDPALNAAEIVRATHANKDQLNKEFRVVTNRTIYQYLLDYRLYSATRKLRFTALTVDEISYLCGFSSPANFSFVFKQKNGLSPSYFRQQVIRERMTFFQM